MAHTPRLAVAAAPWLALLAACGPSTPEHVWLGELPAEAPCWSPVELALQTDLGYDNPFDPEQIAVWLELEPPQGPRREVAGFWHQPFSRALVEGAEQLTPVGEPGFHVRFTLDAPGRWRLRAGARAGALESRTPWRSLLALPPEAGAHGLLRPSPEDPRYLRYDDGTSYFAVGENLCWYDGRGSYAYDDWLDELQAVGANFVRLWMPAWAFGLEAMDDDPAAGPISTLGDYTRRLDRAWQLDRVLEQARLRGIQVMLCLQNHGMFSLDHNSEWAVNPYNQALGGPLAVPQDFFTQPEARALFERRLRYAAARWGAFPNLMAWELWNEVDLTAQHDVQTLADWHADLSAFLSSQDPHGRMVTTSTSQFMAPLLGLDEALDASPGLALAQIHVYGFPGSDPDFSEVVPRLGAARGASGKPVLAAELGVDYRGAVETLQRDPTFAGLRDLIWSGIFAGTAGTGMTWWWDSLIDPQGLYGLLGAAAAFVEGIAFDREAFLAGQALLTGVGERPVAALELRGRSTCLAWLKDRGALWSSGLAPASVAGASLRLEGLADGAWRGRWVDTWTGAQVAPAEAQVTGGAATLAVPAFLGDLGLRLTREP
jgi:hypothetical protein